VKVTLIATLAVLFPLTGCALHAPMTATSAQAIAGANARALPHTAVVYCHWNGSHCEPPMTTSQGKLSGTVDAYGNIGFNDPDGLPPR
jgi:uncharacterized lipoprotein NlpE involved in copper resistance